VRTTLSTQVGVLIVKRVVPTRLRTRPSPPAFRAVLVQLAMVSTYLVQLAKTLFALLVRPGSSVLVATIPASGVAKGKCAPWALSRQCFARRAHTLVLLGKRHVSSVKQGMSAMEASDNSVQQQEHTVRLDPPL
jgi:hypothetical protein